MKSLLTVLLTTLMFSAPALAEQPSLTEEAMARMALRQIVKKDLLPKSDFKKYQVTTIRQVLGEVPLDKHTLKLSLFSVYCQPSKTQDLSCVTAIFSEFKDGEGSMQLEYTVKPDGSVTSVLVNLAG